MQLIAIMEDPLCVFPAGMLAKLVSENSRRGISWGFSEVVVDLFVWFLLPFLLRKERKQPAGAVWEAGASLSSLLPSADFGAPMIRAETVREVAEHCWCLSDHGKTQLSLQERSKNPPGAWVLRSEGREQERRPGGQDIYLPFELS